MSGRRRIALLMLGCLCAVQTGYAEPPGLEPVDWMPDYSMRLMKPGSLAGDDMGAAVSMAGDLAIVGRPRADHDANQGAEGYGDVHVYRWNYSYNMWDWEADLINLVNVQSSSANFGAAVHTDGQRIIVGAPNETVNGMADAGRVYIFEFDGVDWGLAQTFDGANWGQPGDHVGASVHIAGTEVLFGATGYDGSWSIGTVFYASLSREGAPSMVPPPGLHRGTSIEAMGASLARWNDYVVIGAPETNTNGVYHGRAYLYTVVDGAWTWEASFNPPTDWMTVNCYAGTSVAMDGMHIAVGAPAYYYGDDHGHVQTWSMVDGSWTADTVTIDHPNQPNTGFGSSVDMSAGRLAVGAKFADDRGSWSGHVSMFDWSPSGGFFAFDTSVMNYYGESADFMGVAVVLEGDRMLAGVPDATVPGYGGWRKAGAAYFYTYQDNDTWQVDLRPMAAVRINSADIIDPTPNTSTYHSTAFSTELAQLGNVLLVGEPNEDRVDVYRRSSMSSPWVRDEINTIQTPGTVQDWHTFGSSIAMSADLVVIGGNDAATWTGGHVWRYVRNPDGSFSAPLEILHKPVHRIGDDIAIQPTDLDTYVAIGVPSTTMPVGAEGEVHMVLLDATDGSNLGNWILTDPAWDGSEYSIFGQSVDMAPIESGVMLAAGNAGDDGSGSVQIFEVHPPWWPWVHTASLHGQQTPGLTHADTFGSDVALDGDLLVVGDFAGGQFEGAGQIAIFRRESIGNWDMEKRIFSPFELAYDHFGAAVDIRDATADTPPRVIVGAPGSDYMGINTGTICTYVYNSGPDDWFPTEFLVAGDPTLFEGLGAELTADTRTVLAGCTGWFGSVDEARVLDFSLHTYAIWSDDYWGDLSDPSNWDNPPSVSAGFTTALFSLLINPYHTVFFDQDVWDGSMEFVHSHMSLKLLADQRQILGDILVAGDPVIRAPFLSIGNGQLVVHGSATIGDPDGRVGMLNFTDIDARVHDALTMHKGSTLSFGLNSSLPTQLSVKNCSLGGTLDVTGSASDLALLNEGDRFVLLRSDTPPADGLFDLVVLPGLPNGLAFQLSYGAPGVRSGGCSDGLIADCYGNCAPAYWVGDGYCDDGTYSYGGMPIYFNCDQFNCDGGDCASDNCGDTAWEAVIEVVTLEGLLNFGDPNSVAVPGQPTAVEVVDLNNDGADEICVTFAGAPGTLAIFENDGSGGVAQQIILPIHDGPVDLTSGDFDGDGNTDLAVGHHLSKDVLVLFNDDADPSNGFTEQVLPAIGPVNCVTRADIDETFPMDIMACIADSNGDGEGSWQWWFGQSAMFTGPGGGGGLGGGGNQGSGPGMEPVFGDPSDDEDQKNHVVHGGTANGRSIVVKGNQAGGLTGQGTFVFDTYPVGANPGSVASGDFNGDGHVDLAYTSITNGTVVILLQDPVDTGTYQQALSIPLGDEPTDITSIDFNNDGTPDIAAVIKVEGVPRVRVLQNEGNMLFTTVDTAIDEGVVLVDAGDVSGNDAIELVTVGGGSDQFLVPPLLTVRANTSITCPGDTDSDGVVDVDDMLMVLSQFGPCPGGCSGDFNDDGAVTIDDLLTLIGAWGPCPR